MRGISPSWEPVMWHDTARDDAPLIVKLGDGFLVCRESQSVNTDKSEIEEFTTNSLADAFSMAERVHVPGHPLRFSVRGLHIR